MEVGAREGDVGALRRNLDQIREGVEEGVELRVFNEKRLGSREGGDS